MGVYGGGVYELYVDVVVVEVVYKCGDVFWEFGLGVVYIFVVECCEVEFVVVEYLWCFVDELG